MRKDFNIKITVRNNHLLSAVQEQFGTNAEFCRQTGINPSRLASYMTMKKIPVDDKGWKNDAVNIASALGLYPSEIWPEHMQMARLKMSTAEVSLDAQDVRQIMSIGQEIDQVAASDLLEKLMADLTPRYKAFMKWRLLAGSEATLDECCEVLGVSRERARQIERKSISRMKMKAYRLGVKSITDLTI